ncbi:DUF1801 domain-containing protein [Sphingobacterium litopenaei]|uniref:DUF1801 domain-containing protein n=1 Tax=Sphingobacterium litopenaei TaxID=2763500 RepID=A0ABR7YH30_9SPHI|nr:DUF1801 domain-containing protein [Sphingobacterium litopenaei]MBD1430622.1 DUF1801 domain-containing protein [Sphingobacterium litopenaei]
MNKDFENIDEYIALQEPLHQKKLMQLRSIIAEIVPEGTKETISYKIPTFRLNGNLIHFAQFKNHIGIYPGSEAIEAFQERLHSYKTSKGAIQIPNSSPIDKDLIYDIVQYNIEILRQKKSPNWTSYQNQWQELYEKMNVTISKLNLKKEIKWGMDIYTFERKNVLGWAGFKNFFSIWFYNGVFLSDPYSVLVAATEGKTKSLRQWRLKNANEFDEKKIIEYIEDSIQTIKDGKFVPAEKGIKKEAEGVLKDELLINKVLKQAFEKLTPGKQKEYIEYIEEAKQEKTKLTRLEKIIPFILGGKGLNDKYKR